MPVARQPHLARSPSPGSPIHGAGHHPHPRCSHAQPEEHRPRPAARQADRDHRPVRLRQVVAGVRHHLRRRSAPLRGVAVGIRAPVPERDGQARHRPHRRLEPGDFDRAEIHQPQPAIDGRHDHRDPRLPAPAVRARGHAALPRPPLPAGSADGQPDGRPGAGDGRGRGPGCAALDAAGTGGARPQGRAAAGVRPVARAGLRAGARGRRAPRDRRGAAAGAAPETHHRGGDRPLQAARGHPPAPRRIVRDLPEAGRRHGDRAVHGRAGARAAAVLVEVLLPGLRLRVAGTGTAAVLVQCADGRLPGLRRPGRGPVLRSVARGRPSGAVAGGRRDARLGPPQRVLLLDDHLAREALRIRRRPALAAAAGRDPRDRPARQRQGGDQPGLRGRERQQVPAQARLRGHHPEPGAPLPRDGIRGGARGTVQVHQRAPLPRMRRRAPEPLRPQRVRGRPPAARNRGDADRQLPRLLPRLEAARLARRDRDQDRQGNRRATELPGRRRPRLPHPRAQGRQPVGRRGATHPPGVADRCRPGRGDVRARRTQHRPAPARQRAPARYPHPPARPGQHGDRRRTRRGRDPPGRPRGRHRTGCRRTATRPTAS